MATPVPYSSTPIFDEQSLPDAIRSAHNTKAGVWGLLVMLEGEASLVFHDPRRVVEVSPGKPALIAPQAVHHVETAGPMQMKVEFYREHPLGEAA